MKNGLLIVFNWKENPETSREASRLFTELAAASKNNGRATIVACPPFVYLAELSKKLAAVRGRFLLGVQDIFWENKGAYTGEIGSAMLRGIGKNVQYAIVGHSERRQFLGETDDMVNKKVRAAIAAGFHVILCVGEPIAIRKKGIGAARQYVKNQLKKDLHGVSLSHTKGSGLAIAYEPIWAIGTGRNCPPAEALAMAKFIKDIAGNYPVLYGGSVDGANIGDYLCYDEINGVLVGGASLRGKEIKKIIHHGEKRYS